jgi:hypothetical protein
VKSKQGLGHAGYASRSATNAVTDLAKHLYHAALIPATLTSRVVKRGEKLKRPWSISTTTQLYKHYCIVLYWSKKFEHSHLFYRLRSRVRRARRGTVLTSSSSPATCDHAPGGSNIVMLLSRAEARARDKEDRTHGGRVVRPFSLRTVSRVLKCFGYHGMCRFNAYRIAQLQAAAERTATHQSSPGNLAV